MSWFEVKVICSINNRTRKQTRKHTNTQTHKQPTATKSQQTVNARHEHLCQIETVANIADRVRAGENQ